MMEKAMLWLCPTKSRNVDHVIGDRKRRNNPGCQVCLHCTWNTHVGLYTAGGWGCLVVLTGKGRVGGGVCE